MSCLKGLSITTTRRTPVISSIQSIRDTGIKTIVRSYSNSIAEPEAGCFRATLSLNQKITKPVIVDGIGIVAESAKRTPPIIITKETLVHLGACCYSCGVKSWNIFFSLDTTTTIQQLFKVEFHT